MKTLKTSIKTANLGHNKSLSATVRLRGSTLQKIRREKLLANPACEICLSKGMVTPAKEVDHIVPLWKGGAESNCNRQSLCVSCHKEKSDKETKQRLGINV